MGFIDDQHAQGRAVESICRVLTAEGCQVAARTYRTWKHAGPTAREHAEALVINAIRDASWRVDHHGERRPTPVSLYGRRKMTMELRRRGTRAAECTVAGAMKTLGMSGVRRGKAPRITIRAKDGHRAGDLLDRNFTASAPNQTWVPGIHQASPTSARGWGSSMSRSSLTASPIRSWPGTPRRRRPPTW